MNRIKNFPLRNIFLVDIEMVFCFFCRTQSRKRIQFEYVRKFQLEKHVAGDCVAARMHESMRWTRERNRPALWTHRQRYNTLGSVHSCKRRGAMRCVRAVAVRCASITATSHAPKTNSKQNLVCHSRSTMQEQCALLKMLSAIVCFQKVDKWNSSRQSVDFVVCVVSYRENFEQLNKIGRKKKYFYNFTILWTENWDRWPICIAN